MSFAKPTLRRNKQHMITVRVRHDLDGDEITAILAISEWGERTDYGQKPDAILSRRTAEKAIRTYLTTAGTGDLWIWHEQVGAEEADQAWSWTRSQVLRLWPALTVDERSREEQ